MIKARVRHRHPDASQSRVLEAEIAPAESPPSALKWVLLEALSVKSPIALIEVLVTVNLREIEKGVKSCLLGGCSHEIPNCNMRRCRLSGCGRLGAVFLLCFPKSDYSRRTDCVESRPFDSANRARRFSFPLRHWCLLGHSCEYCYVWIDRPDRGNNAAEATSRTLEAHSLGCRRAVDRPTPTRYKFHWADQLS